MEARPSGVGKKQNDRKRKRPKNDEYQPVRKHAPSRDVLPEPQEQTRGVPRREASLKITDLRESSSDSDSAHSTTSIPNRPRKHVIASDSLLTKKGGVPIPNEPENTSHDAPRPVQTLQEHKLLSRSDFIELLTTLDRGHAAQVRQTQELEISVKTMKSQLLQRDVENAKLQATVDSLNQKNEELETFSTGLRAQVDQLANEAMPPEAENYVKVSDDTIVQEWGELLYNIRNFASTLLNAKPNRLESGPSHCGTAVELRENCLKHPELAIFFIQQFIWKRLESDIFLGRAGIWAGYLGERFTALHDGFLVEGSKNERFMAVFSRIKSLTAHELDQLYDNHDTLIRRLVKHVIQDLFGFVPAEKHRKLRKRLIRIVTQASELHVIFLKSKAFFFPAVIHKYSETYGSYFNEETMEICYSFDGSYPADGPIPDGHCVGIVSSPVLIKVGNADGDNFASHAVLCKARVTVSRFR